MSESERAAVVERAARAGAAVAMDAFRTDVDVETKSGKTDVVTQVDRDAQARTLDVISDHFPGETIVAEEDERTESIPSTGAAWIVDPIDGTANYVRGIRTWATSVAAVVDGTPVGAATILPAEGDAYVADDSTATLNGKPIAVSDRTDPETFAVIPTMWWPFEERAEYATAYQSLVTRFGDVRRMGCAQGELGMLASGQVEGVITNRYVHPWDTVAGVHLVKLAGGTVTDVHGNPWHVGAKGLVASNGRAHETVLEAAREIVSVEP
jgi:myo-inositol-1(or 4)-monophosphatase